MPPASVQTEALPEIYYPSSDGRPLGETGWHATSTLTLFGMLREYLARRDAYVAANMFLYYEQGNPKANRSPDCMVIFGIGKKERRSFKTWVEGAVPSVIFEFASVETVDEDTDAKVELYARLGVAEYFLFDPLGECLDPRLQGHRLEGDRYVPLTPDADGGLISEVLGLRLVPEDYLLRLWILETGQLIPTDQEKTAALEAEREIRDRERKRAERERKRAYRERKRAEQEALRTEQERLRAEQEKERADALAAEVARLKALLGGRGGVNETGAGGE